MIVTKKVLIEKVILDKFICSRCKGIIKAEDEMELQETYSINFTGGYNSVFGDGCTISCDLCQHCLKDLIGDFCRKEEE